MLQRVLAFPALRLRTTLVTLMAWLLVLGVGAPLGAKFEGVISNEPASFLPGGAESVRVAELVRGFPEGELTPAIVVASNPAGLTPAQRSAMDAARARLAAAPPAKALAPTPVVPSADGTTVLFTVPLKVTGDADALVDAVKRIRREAPPDGGGLTVRTTGPAGFSADAIAVFGDINTTLLLATGALVIVLLLLIYRSPVFWVLPLLCIAVAEATLRALGYLMGSNGVVINGQTQGITLVLVFGAGTDYALLLVARYREELHRHERPRDAVRVALLRAGPAILASAGTVIAGLLVLLAARVNGTAGLGPLGAVGVAVAALVMLTLLPVLLIACGRRAFWPFVPRHDATDPGLATRGAWRSVGERVTRRPRPVWITTAVALAVLCAGVLAYDDGLTSGNGFRGTVEAVRGQALLAAAFPAGSSAPTTLLVTDPAQAPTVREAALAVPGVEAVSPPRQGPPGARMDVTLRPDPFSQEAYDLIGTLRDGVRAVAGPAALVGGTTAEEADVRAAAVRDDLVLPPLILAVVLVILCALLRAVVAPLLLVATVILSFAAAFGVSMLVFNVLLDSPGQDPSLALYGFVFLVALGVDYNIFLMARAREESDRHGTREGMLRALAVTGGVITSAGIVLAGTFAVLGVLPLWALFQLGFLVGFGVLLDTLVVRSVLVPALVADIGDRVWWPSHPHGGGNTPVGPV